MKTSFLLVTLLSVSTALVAADSKSATEQRLKDLDMEWCKAFAAHDIDKTVSYYSDDAIVLPSNAPIANTKEAIQKTWKDLSDTPGLSLTWKVTRVEVAASGDMAYVSGTYEMTIKNPGSPDVNDHGKYLEVWEKKKGGTWKCGADTWNSDLPMPPAEKK